MPFLDIFHHFIKKTSTVENTCHKNSRKRRGMIKSNPYLQCRNSKQNIKMVLKEDCTEALNCHSQRTDMKNLE